MSEHKHEINEDDDLLAMIEKTEAEKQIDLDTKEDSEATKDEIVSDGESAVVETKINSDLIIDDGDIFVNQKNVPTMVILATTIMASGAKNYRVRFPLVVDKPITIGEDEVMNFINLNQLSKLPMQLDSMRDICAKIVLRQDDVFTKDGDTIAAIYTDVFVGIDSFGQGSEVVGCSFYGRAGVMRDAFEVKAFLFDNADEFASLRNEIEG
jgi:hypothetical protein